MPPATRPKPAIWTPERVEHWQRTGQVPSKVMVWTPEQTGRFLDHTVHDRLYPLFHLVAHVGLRWVDTHLQAGTIDVLNQIVQYGWETGQATPKTDASAATVALDTDTIAVLAEHQTHQRADRGKAGKAWVETGLVFTEPDGSPPHPADVTDHFQHLTRQAGLPPRSGCTTCATAPPPSRWRPGWR